MKYFTFSLGVAGLAMTSFGNESERSDVLSFGVNDFTRVSAYVRAHIPRVLCFFLSHLSQGCATKVSILFNNVPLFPENEGLF